MEGEARTGLRTGSARVLIADDHDLVRDGYQRMLDREPDLEVIGEAKDGREAIELCRRLSPDLVLMDVRMPRMDGIEATRRIKGELPATSVLVVTTYDNPDYLFEAVEAGAAGYVLKDAPKAQLLGAVRRTLNGESPLNQELAMQLISRFSRQEAHGLREPAASPAASRPRGADKSPPEALTPRELEVLGLLARGKSNPQIAQELTISRATAKTHVERIIGKLGVSDRTQAALRAIELGLVTPEAGSSPPASGGKRRGGLPSIRGGRAPGRDESQAGSGGSRKPNGVPGEIRRTP